MKSLTIGDPHIQVSNLEESEKLFNFYYSIASDPANEIERIVILGDLTHTKDVIRGLVLNFWDRWLNTFSSLHPTVVLVGNHDLSCNTNNAIHSLVPFKGKYKNLSIVDRPCAMDNIGFLPYYHDKEEFVSEANGLVGRGYKTIICHQTFAGSKFENGFYAPDGVNPDLIDAETIISGHIHSTQSFSKVFYPGTAAWHIASDANQKKGVWIIEYAPDGSVISKKMIETDKVVTPIVSVDINEGEEIPTIPTDAKVFINLKGSSRWITKTAKDLKGMGSIRGTPTDSKEKKKRMANRELGIYSYLDSYALSPEVNKEDMKTYLRELGIGQ